MLNDYELLYLIREKNEYALKLLYNKYHCFICYKVSNYSKTNYDFDDYYNEAISAFLEAIEEYKDNTRFITFLNICIERKLYNYKESLNRKKYTISNTSSRLDNSCIIAKDNNTPEKIFIENENYNCIKNLIISKLTPREELVFNLKEQNFSSNEIARILDIKQYIVYKVLKNIRIKTNKVLLDYDI